MIAGSGLASLFEERCARSGFLERQGLRIERGRQVGHVEDVWPEAADVLARVRAEAADQGGRDGVLISVHGGQRGGHVGDVGEHDSVGDEARVFELFLLFDWIAARAQASGITVKSCRMTTSCCGRVRTSISSLACSTI